MQLVCHCLEISEVCLGLQLNINLTSQPLCGALGKVSELTELRLMRRHARVSLFLTNLERTVNPLKLRSVKCGCLLVRCILMVLECQIMLKYLVLVRLVVDCAHQVLEASDVDLIVENPLQIFKVYLFGKNGFQFRLVRLSM